MTFSKMPLKTSQKWPQQYGFDITGSGPCYVIVVEKGSIAFSSGLLPGDQILELDDQDVTEMSAEALKTLAKHSRTQPPTIGVVSRLLHLDLLGNRTMGLGFSVYDNQQPVTVLVVEEGGPAHVAGIRAGDIILEMNRKPVFVPDDVRPLLPSHNRQISMSVIPAGKSTTAVRVKEMSPALSSGSRVKRAKDLHERMNELLGEDYEKKMAIVGVLKQYAEDRDVEMLARALTVILKTPQQRKLIRQIRPFIPPRQRGRFDTVAKQQMRFIQEQTPETPPSSPAHTHKLGQRRACQIMRNGGSFGFVIKGSTPAYVETVDPGGAADRAGLQPGDYVIKLNGIDVRKCSHTHLVHLLQESGAAPILEVLRCDQDEEEITLGTSTPSSASSGTSHSDTEWTSADSRYTLEKEGKNFQQQVEYLLTKKERRQMKRILVEYENSNNIAVFYEDLYDLLDTPSKKVLWTFILVKLSPPHRDYCSGKIDLPQHSLPTDESSQSSWGSIPYTGTSTKFKISSFQQQVEYLMTSRERSQLKKALQLYSDNRNVDHLVEDLDVIMDTPSKRTLWMYIIPLLSVPHQEQVRQRISSKTKTALVNTSQRKTKEPYFSSEDDEHELFSKTGARKLKGKPGHGGMKGLDFALIKELEETRKAVQEAKELFQASRTHLELSPEDAQGKRYITVIPVEAGVTEQGPQPITIAVQSPIKESIKVPSNGLTVPPEIVLSGSDSCSEPDTEGPKEEAARRFSVMSSSTFNRHALVALKELDAAMAAEVSDLEKVVGSSAGLKETNPSSVKSSPLLAPPAPPPPPPPPAPPLPAPPPLPSPAGVKGEKSQMNVKRINWEKLDQQKVENTIWEQINVTESADLNDVVKYLELEQHFSVRSPKSIDDVWNPKPMRKQYLSPRYRPCRCPCTCRSTKVIEKKTEVYILNPKKAYNISILLGHLKLSLSEAKQALYSLDEEILTPELLKQLIAYIPSKDEMEKLDEYSGDIEELSKPDRFAYEMTRVPGYEQRLKALLFKGNFHEKIEEMKENLQHIRKASLELRHSRRLAKILELILAMGNYMNQGNQRVGEAAGFKIAFLSQLEITKTADKKSTFLHVLAEAVYNKFPDVMAVGEQLTTVPVAAKVSNVLINQELQDLRKVLQDISATLEKFGSQKTSIGVNDRFQDVMGHFISEASDEIQSLFRLQASAMEEFHNMVQYFGEDTKSITTMELFGIFSQFITKFEKSHRENMINKRHNSTS